MKNKGSLALVSVTAAAVIFAGGFFLGRCVEPFRIPAVTHASPAPSEANLDTAVSTAPPATSATQALLVNINTAGVEELENLPGIGAVLAQRIVDYRSEYGPFTVPEEICNVPGIGEKKLAAILDFITVGGNT